MPRQKDICSTCGSSKWRKNASSGVVMCEEGHLLIGYRDEHNEVDGEAVGTQGSRKRALKSQRDIKGRTSKVDSKYLTGERKRAFYFHCQQTILRLQVDFLVKTWHLPRDPFENVCREIWTLHLMRLSADRENRRKRQDEAASGQGFDSEDTSSPSDSDSTPDLDPGISQLLEEDYELSDSASPGAIGTSHDSNRRRKVEALPYGHMAVPASNISILVIACWTLRIPVIYGDFIRMIMSYQLPYLEPMRHLPSTYRFMMTVSLSKALEPKHPPTTARLHTLTHILAGRLKSDFNVVIPELNAPVVFWRAVRAFRGTALLYSMAKSLSWALELPLTLNQTLAPSITQIRARDGTIYRGDDVAPELAIASVLVLVLKMVYGLDSSRRLLDDPKDPGAAFPDIEDYFSALRGDLEAERLGVESLMDPRSSRVATDLGDAEVDHFLSFCRNALLRPDGNPLTATDFDSFARVFPIRESPAGDVVRVGGIVQPSSGDKLGSPVSPEDREQEFHLNASGEKVRPGGEYSIFHSSDVMGSLDPHMEIIMETAAKWASVDREEIATMLEILERRLYKWAAALSRAKEYEDGNEPRPGRKRTKP